MLIALKNTVARLRKDEDGVTLVEYGIALVLAIAVGTLLLSTLADGVEENLALACDALGVGAAAACAP